MAAFTSQVSLDDRKSRLVAKELLTPVSCQFLGFSRRVQYTFSAQTIWIISSIPVKVSEKHNFNVSCKGQIVEILWKVCVQNSPVSG